MKDIIGLLRLVEKDLHTRFSNPWRPLVRSCHAAGVPVRDDARYLSSSVSMQTRDH